MRCALAACLACLLSGLLLAQVPPSPSTDYRPGASRNASLLPTPGPLMPSDPSGTLSGASSELALIADELETLLTALDKSLTAAGIYQDASARSLEDSIRSATSGIDSLAALRADLATATRLASRRSLVAGLWRVGALSGIAGLIGALADAGRLRGAGIGAGLGAVAGGVWMLAERWPPRLNLP